jgi:hypothetical protein
MKTQPCGNCIGLAVCINKGWAKVVKDCTLVTDYMISFLREQNLEGMIVKCKIDSLRKEFDLSPVGPGVGRLHIAEPYTGFAREWITVGVPREDMWEGDPL